MRGVLVLLVVCFSFYVAADLKISCSEGQNFGDAVSSAISGAIISNLTGVTINDCNISKLSKDIDLFKSLPHLQTLTINGSSIESVERDAFQNNKELKSVTIVSNPHAEQIHGDLLALLLSLRVLQSFEFGKSGTPSDQLKEHVNLRVRSINSNREIDTMKVGDTVEVECELAETRPECDYILQLHAVTGDQSPSWKTWKTSTYNNTITAKGRVNPNGDSMMVCRAVINQKCGGSYPLDDELLLKEGETIHGDQ